MALNFPNSPTNGQLFVDTASGNRWVWDTANTCWKSTSAFTQTVTVSSTAPGSPVVGQLWWNQDYGRLMVYYNDGSSSQWVDASPSDFTSIAAYNNANSAFNLANISYNFSNTTYTFANIAFAGLNISYSTANAAFNTANAGFAKANNALPNSSATYAGNMTVSGTLTTVGNMYAPIYYDSAETSYFLNPNGDSNFKGHLRLGPYASSTSTGNLTNLELMNNSGTGDANVSAISFHCQGQYGTHLHLRADSYFGVGGWSAGTWRWYVNLSTGDMTAVGNVTAYSDPRLKEDISNIRSSLKKILTLNGVRFRWKDNSIVGHPGEYDYGVLANEIEAIAPEIVTECQNTDENGIKYKTVAYDKLVPFLIEAIKEQQKQIDELKKRVDNVTG